MSWYRTGTAAFTNGNATVTGTGTAWIANASIGEGLIGPDGRTYEITDIASNTSLTISPPYLGSTASAQAYAIAPLRGRIADLIAEASSLLSSFATVRDGIGAGLFPDGEATTPAFRFTSDQDTGMYSAGSNTIAWASGGVERARITSDGSFGVGRATPISIFNIQRNGSADTIASSASIVLSNLSGTSGTYLAGGIFSNSYRDISALEITAGIWFERQDNILSGSGATQGAVVIGTQATAGSTGLPTERLRVTAQGTVRPGADNGQTLGDGSFRWSTVFAGTGTINTSDVREKTWRGALTPPELRAAKRIIAELGIYQWNDAIAIKGPDDARLHFGVRAQQAFDIMEDEGLDWSRYAWCCHDTWMDGDRYGVRPDQLAFWLIAAQADIQADLEARLTALETA